ncbi:hypothetical protein D5H75_40595 [Bailinhaonella thermotolerans]|uniref:Uncharacterized protein n=1 Tax=Bailinhaonella thermotolerans TaxID=1070861 RepID=A0A3A3ZX54_9ACTN|nr:hypothetical protein D5H75_40595 [Bailinhaonella thermotolerans]
MVKAGANVRVDGRGSEREPYVVAARPPGGADPCVPIQDCAAPGIGPGLVWDTGARRLDVRLSAAPGNGLTFGADQGLYASATGAGCTQIQDCAAAAWGPGLVWSAGARTLGVRISTDVGNVATVNPDGLYAPEGGAPPGPAWTAFTTAGLGSGWALGTPAPQWRRWPNGLVQMRGVINRTSTTAAANVYTGLPTALRVPAGRYSKFRVVGNQGAVAVVSVTIRSDGSMGAVRTNINSTTWSFVCLDSIRYAGA